MTALAKNTQRAGRKLGVRHTIPVNGGSRIYEGALVMIDPDGYARPAAALASNQGCVGVATREANNTSGADGDIKVEVQEGEFLFTGTTLAQSVVSAKVYAEDDDVVDETQDATQPLAGLATEFVSATQCWVKVGMSESKL